MKYKLFDRVIVKSKNNEESIFYDQNVGIVIGYKKEIRKIEYLIMFQDNVNSSCTPMHWFDESDLTKTQVN